MVTMGIAPIKVHYYYYNWIQHAAGRHEDVSEEKEAVRICLPIIRPGNDHLARKALRGEQEEGEGDGSSAKTTSESGQDWTFWSHRGLWKTTSESGQGWTFWSHRGLWKKTFRDGGSWL